MDNETEIKIAFERDHKILMYIHCFLYSAIFIGMIYFDYEWFFVALVPVAFFLQMRDIQKKYKKLKSLGLYD